jgi:hypothetical protein
MLRILGSGRSAVQTIEDELHCRGPALYDHPLKNPGDAVLALMRIERWALGVGRWALSNGIGGARVKSAKQNNERENEGNQGFL